MHIMFMNRTSCIKQATFLNFIMHTLKSFSEMACSRFLNFQPTERPQWWGIEDTIPSVSKMITDILEYRKNGIDLKMKIPNNVQMLIERCM